MMTRTARRSALGAAFLLAACSAGGSPDPLAGFGPDPRLPPPTRSIVPQIGIAQPVAPRRRKVE